jgi:hypothetical protein
MHRIIITCYFVQILNRKEMTSHVFHFVTVAPHSDSVYKYQINQFLPQTV